MGTDYATVAKLLANPARSAVVDALMAGRPLAAGELAQLAGVRAPTISEHLAQLVDGGLVAVLSSGRHRYYRLASAEVAEALEALARICPDKPVRSLRQSAAFRSLRRARLCYDHVAGVLGVALLDEMCSSGWVVSRPGPAAVCAFEVTPLGMQSFASIGVDVDGCRRARRQFARSCLDWSERRAHLAGALGAAVTSALLDQQWLRRTSPGRGIEVTPQGEHALQEVFTISISDVYAENP